MSKARIHSLEEQYAYLGGKSPCIDFNLHLQLGLYKACNENIISLEKIEHAYALQEEPMNTLRRVASEMQNVNV